MSYLLDANVVSFFLQAGREGDLATAAKRCPMAIVDVVRGELEKDKNRGGKAFRRWFDASNIEERSMLVGSPASATLARLASPASSTRDRGERVSIALASSDPSLVFVAHDRNALWLALRELWMPGERIIGLAVFLRRLVEHATLQDPEVLDDVMAIADEHAKHIPTWWEAWRTSLESSSVSVRSPVNHQPESIQ